jgi:hypothetical protein
MIDRELSGAVIAYVWGRPRRAWPGRDTTVVHELLGERADLVLGRIGAIFAVVDAAPLDWDAEDLCGASLRIHRLVHRGHPELDAEALHAIGAQFAYTWK